MEVVKCDESAVALILHPLPNKHYVSAAIGGRKVAVLVRDNARYRRGMSVRVTQVTTHIWEADGQ